MLTLLNLEAELWQALIMVMGDPGQDLRQVAALNRWAITQAISNVQLASGAPLSVVQAAQLGLAWRCCRKALLLEAGGNADDFEDIDPGINNLRPHRSRQPRVAVLSRRAC